MITEALEGKTKSDALAEINAWMNGTEPYCNDRGKRSLADAYTEIVRQPEKWWDAHSEWVCDNARWILLGLMVGCGLPRWNSVFQHDEWIETYRHFATMDRLSKFQLT